MAYELPLLAFTGDMLLLDEHRAYWAVLIISSSFELGRCVLYFSFISKFVFFYLTLAPLCSF